MSENGTTPPASKDAPRRKIGRPFQPGQSGNPSGRPRVEPRVRRFARKFDRRMCQVLADLATDPKVPAAERRRAAGDLIAIGSGRPALVQEISGKDGEPLAPLVAMQFNSQPGQQLSPEAAYRMMCEGTIEASGDHPAFKSARRVIDAEPAPAMAAEPAKGQGSDSPAPGALGAVPDDAVTDKRVLPRDDLRRTVEGLVK